MIRWDVYIRQAWAAPRRRRGVSSLAAIPRMAPSPRYDGAEMIGEYSGTNALLRRYVHGPGDDQPLVWYEGALGITVTRPYLPLILTLLSG
jgi:hypothetical protein